MIKSALCAVFTLLLFSGVAQRYSFVSYSNEDGLPQSQVTSITQDHKGYLWVGTLGGLAKFTGREFTTFSYENGLFNNKITYVIELKNEMWIGHEGGVSLMTTDTIQTWSLPLDYKDVQVWSIFNFGDEVMVLTNGAGLYRITGKQLVAVNIPEESSGRMRDAVFYDGSYFLGTRTGLYQTKDFKSFHHFKASSDWSISDLSVGPRGLIINNFYDDVYIYSNGHFELFELPADVNPRITYVDRAGNYWIGASEGLFFKDEKQTKYLSNEKGLPLERINAIFEDDEGNIWLGTLGKGLVNFPGFEFVHFNQTTGMPTDLVVNVNQDQSQTLWIGTYDKGLIKWKDGQSEIVDAENGTIWTSAMDVNGSNWFGSGTGLVEVKNGKKIQTLKIKDGLLRDKTTSLYKVSDKKMLIGGSGGLMLYDQGKLTVLHNNEEHDIGTIRNMEYFKNTLYLASDKGFHRFENGQVTAVDSFYRTTYSMVNLADEYLFLGTEEGLFRYSGNQVESKSFSAQPSSKFINFVNLKNRDLYLGTNNGLFVLTIDEKGEIVKQNHFGIQEGVVNLETNLNSGFFDQNDNFWFGTASGLVQFEGLKQEQRIYSPRINLESILLNYKEIPEAKRSKTLERIPFNKNNISFQFDGISLSQPSSLKFQYWLEGVEADWAPVTDNQNPTYTALSPGTYRLHARTVGFRGKVSEEIVLPFTIASPFYSTWWFLLSVTVVLALIIVQIFRFRLGKERDKNEIVKGQFKTKLMALEQQSLSASMNRHFIFNSLNSIQYFINTQDKRSANKYLTNFAQLIRKNLDAAGSTDIRIPLSKELERLELYLSLEAMRFKDRFTYQIRVHDVDSEGISIPAMLLQPFVENSIIHGILPKEDQAGEITIDVRQEEQSLKIEIRDNGIGISKSIRRKEVVDGDHKSQGMEITTKRIELIKKLSKQAFEIIGPEDWLDEHHRINGTVVWLKIPFYVLDEVD